MVRDACKLRATGRTLSVGKPVGKIGLVGGKNREREPWARWTLSRVRDPFARQTLTTGGKTDTEATELTVVACTERSCQVAKTATATGTRRITCARSTWPLAGPAAGA